MAGLAFRGGRRWAFGERHEAEDRAPPASGAQLAGGPEAGGGGGAELAELGCGGGDAGRVRGRRDLGGIGKASLNWEGFTELGGLH